MSILSSHAASWHSDKWYRRAWYIWPQVASLLVIGWVFAGVLPNPPWARPEPQPPSRPSEPPKQPPPPRPAPRPDTGASSGYRLGQECATGWSAQECAIWRLTGVHNYIAVSKPQEISASGLTTPAVQLAGGHYEMPGYRWVSDDIQVGGKPYTRVGLVWAPVEQAEEPEAPKPAKYVVDGISLGARVSFKSSDYQEYQCRPSEQFEGVTWCNKQRVEEEARGSYRSSYTIAHSRDGTIYYFNQFLEPAFFNAGEVDNEIERLSGKFGEPTTQRIDMPRGLADVDGLIATWGRVTLESLDSTAINEWVAGRSPPKGILIDFIGNFSNSARWGLPIYRVSGGPGFVWAASFDPQGRGTLRFFAIDPGALLDCTDA